MTSECWDGAVGLRGTSECWDVGAGLRVTSKSWDGAVGRDGQIYLCTCRMLKTLKI